METDMYKYLAGATFAFSTMIYALSINSLQQLESCPKNLVRNSVLIMAGLSGMLMVFSFNTLLCMNGWLFSEEGKCSLSSSIKQLKFMIGFGVILTLLLLTLSIMAYVESGDTCGGDKLKNNLIINITLSLLMFGSDIYILWDDIKGVFGK